MKKKILILLLPFIFCVFAGFNNLNNNTEDILPYRIHQSKLDNGLNIVTVPFDSPGIVAFYIVVRAGSRNEIEEGVTGFAHFFEHMMFRGTDKYSKEKYDEVLKSIGASANAYTSNDQTVYHMVGNASKIDLMFEVEADRFQNLHYTEHDFKTEAGAVKGEYTKNISNPIAQLYENIANTAFDVHTYKHTTMGFLKDIIDMPNQYEYSLKFFNRFYRPEYATILVVGDITPEKVERLTKKYFGNWKRGSYDPVIPAEPPQTGIRYTHINNGDVPPVLTLNFKGPAFDPNASDIPALEIIGDLYFSRISALYNKLVVNEGKIRNIYLSTPFDRDPSLITISTTLKDKDDMQYVKDEIMKTLEEVKTTTADKQKFADAISNIKYSFAMSNDTPGGIAGMLAYYIALSGNPESVNKYYEQFNKLTVNDLSSIAKKYFKEDYLTIGTIAGSETSPVK